MISQTLTQVQESAIEYALRSKRPNSHRTRRKTCRIVRDYCEAQGYTAEQATQCVRDTLDMIALERNAEF